MFCNLIAHPPLFRAVLDDLEEINESLARWFVEDGHEAGEMTDDSEVELFGLVSEEGVDDGEHGLAGEGGPDDPADLVEAAGDGQFNFLSRGRVTSLFTASRRSISTLSSAQRVAPQTCTTPGR